MFWKNKTPSQLSPDELLHLLRNPNRYSNFDRSTLDELVFSGIRLFGCTGNLEIPSLFGTLYVIYRLDVPVEARLENFLSMDYLVRSKEVFPIALIIYVVEEIDVALVATATMSTAIEGHAKDGPMDSPVLLIDLIKERAVRCPGGVFSGLLFLGDRRVSELLWDARDILDENSLTDVVKNRPPFLYASVLDFWLDWIEEIVSDPNQEQTFSLLCATLVNYAGLVGDEDIVYDVERIFEPAPGVDSVRILKQWPAREYAKVIRDRIQGIAQRETGERILPAVLEAWEL